MAVWDQLRWGGAQVFCPNILSGAPALKNWFSRGEGGGGGGGGGDSWCTFFFFFTCAHKKFLYDHRGWYYLCDTRSKRLERKKKLVARKSSAFARMLLVLCPNMATWKSWGGGGGGEGETPSRTPIPTFLLCLYSKVNIFRLHLTLLMSWMSDVTRR